MTPIWVFSCECCEVFKSSFFIEHFRYLFLNKERVHIECVSLTISYRLCFLRFSKVWSIFYNGSVKRVQSKQCNSLPACTFLPLFYCFPLKKLCLCHFHFFLDEVSNFYNRILANQKPELVIRNCQINYMCRALCWQW